MPNKEATEDKTSQNDNGGEEKATSKEDSQEDEMVPKDKLSSAIAQKKHKEEKLQDLKDQLEDATKEDSAEEKEQKEQLQQKSDESDREWKERMEFRVSNPQYTDEEMDLISKFKGEGESLSEAAKKEEVQDFLDFQEKKEESDKKTPEPSGPSTPSGSDIDYSDEESVKKAEQEARQKRENTGV